MKKRQIITLIVLGFVLYSCNSLKTLTPDAIYSDIGGVEFLANCQFYLSRNITLRAVTDDRQTSFVEGTVERDRLITERLLRISTSTPGILQTRNNTGEILTGYHSYPGTLVEETIVPNTYTRDVWGNLIPYIRRVTTPVVFHEIRILFEEDDDNYIIFRATNNDGLFEIDSIEIEYGGLLYTIESENEGENEAIDKKLYFLRYRLIENIDRQREERRAQGRRVDS